MKIYQRFAASAVAAGLSACMTFAAFAAEDSPFSNRFFVNPSQSSSSAYSFADIQADGTRPGLPSSVNGYGGSASVSPSTSASSIMAMATSAARQYWLPSFGANAPDWAKRIEFEVDVQKNLKPTYSLLTVQPLYQDLNKQNTLFIQASQLRYDMIGKFRDTTNVGLGYRRLLLDNQMLVGINSFFDHEWTYGHQRVSVGGEVKWAMLDFNSNYYQRLSGYKTIDASTDLLERAMSGYDIELRSQVPYLPWLRVGAQYYRWQSNLADDTSGWRYSADADITQNLSIEAGWKKNNYTGTEGFAKFVFRLARTDRTVMLSDKAVSKQIFEQRDMRNYTLDKVRRENRIVVERKGGGDGIVIVRGD